MCILRICIGLIVFIHGVFISDECLPIREISPEMYLGSQVMSNLKRIKVAKNVSYANSLIL
jgi:hypothetical protein